MACKPTWSTPRASRSHADRGRRPTGSTWPCCWARWRPGSGASRTPAGRPPSPPAGRRTCGVKAESAPSWPPSALAPPAGSGHCGRCMGSSTSACPSPGPWRRQLDGLPGEGRAMAAAGAPCGSAPAPVEAPSGGKATPPFSAPRARHRTPSQGRRGSPDEITQVPDATAPTWDIVSLCCWGPAAREPQLRTIAAGKETSGSTQRPLGGVLVR